MGPSFISSFVDEIKRAGLAKSREIRGCSVKEVLKLESFMSVSLPGLYKDFLLAMGHGAGRYYEGTDIFYDSLFNLRGELEDILREDHSSFQLTKDAFVFSGHQGCIFHFFYTLHSKYDPPIYGYREGDGLPRQISPSFSSFLQESLAEFKRMQEAHSLLTTFNENRHGNRRAAYEAGKEFLMKYGWMEGTARSIQRWITDYESEPRR